MLTLITGPVRSGKSDRAAEVATAHGGPVTVIVTAAVDPADAEMNDRIARHRRDRPSAWQVVETSRGPVDGLAVALGRTQPGTCAIVDALGTWLAARMLAIEAAIERDPVAALARLDAEAAAVVQACAGAHADLIVIAEAVGWDVVPPSAQGRIFRDALGRATRALAARAERVELVVAGIPLVVRGAGADTWPSGTPPA